LKTRQIRNITFIKNSPTLNVFLISHPYMYSPLSNKYALMAAWPKLFFFKHSQLKPTIFSFFNKFFYKNYGLLVSNFAKNIIGNLLSTHVRSSAKPLLTRITPRARYITTQYLPNIKVFTLALHKNYFKTVILYFINLLTTYYTPHLQNFRIFFSFIFCPIHIELCTFVNFFYFKVRNF
jgi:hypothetical protein